QTISQPYIVARMTEALLVNGVPQKVLEVGTGSGYQTAILARLVPEVYTVERIAALQDQSRARLHRLRLRNIHYQRSDGSWGWSRYAPYDGIIVTAAPEKVPEELLRRLADGGRLVIPSGPPGQQVLRLLVREGDTIHETTLGRVSFVPLVKGEMS
ncbi:MAG TPA: protein-L-isoaspartate O-methyltransferase, partial [Chromatiales bacterium]|nr:protein-L-isoaspartate O-methyltransferase [Chromatiales bacterium]